MTGSIVIRLISYYFLVVLSADKTIEYLPTDFMSPRAIILILIGMAVLYSYLAGKSNTARFQVTVNAKQLRAQKNDIKGYLTAFAMVAPIAMVILVYFQDAARSGVTVWLGNAIQSIYETPVIGWLFGFAGIIFLITSLLKAWMVSNLLVYRFTSLFRPKEERQEEKFDDYEEVE